MVKRYETQVCGSCEDNEPMGESKSGNYVDYADYLKIEELFLQMAGLVGMNQTMPKGNKQTKAQATNERTI